MSELEKEPILDEVSDDTQDTAVDAQGTVTEEEEETASHHHHHHHRHHSKAYYRYRRKKHKVKKFIRKHKIAFTLTLCGVLIAAVAAGVLIANSRRLDADGGTVAVDTSVTSAEADRSLTVVFPHFGEPQPLVDDLVLQFVNDDTLTPLHDLLEANSVTGRLDYSKGVTLYYSLSNAPADVKVKSAVFEVADNPGFTHAASYDVTDKGGKQVLNYLFTGMRYYYRMNIELDNGEIYTASGSFDTAASPRIITLDGAINVRDIGGWQTAGGKSIKQGLLYRGSEIDGAYEKTLVISNEGVSAAHKYLGIVSDFDLRGLTTEVPEQSAFGSNVNHYVFDAYDYHSALTPTAAPYFKKLFSALAEKKNYPIYLHCSYGFDRSGTACYLLEALLGMSEEDLTREFELSVLCYQSNNPRAKDDNFGTFLTAFYQLDGATPQDKAENFLLSCGVTEKEIQQIKDILLEE